MLSFLSARITGLLAKVFTAHVDEEEILEAGSVYSIISLFEDIAF